MTKKTITIDHSVAVESRKSTQRTWLSAVVAAVVACLVVAGASDVPANAEPLPGTVFSDDFSRVTTSGWGSSSGGHSYTSSTNELSSVDGQAGVIKIKPGQSVTQTVVGVTEDDVSAIGTFWTDAAVTSGNGTTVSLSLRIKGSDQYQARTRIATGGRLVLWVSRVIGGVETKVVNEQVVASGLAMAQKFQSEFWVSGTNPVQLRARTWPLGSDRPGWQAIATDSSSQRISSAGPVAINVYQSSGSPATTLRTDDLSLTHNATGGPTVTTPKTTSQASSPPASPTSTTAATPTSSTLQSSIATSTTVIPSSIGSTTQVGSQPVGVARYQIPSGAYYAAASGSSSGLGTVSSPFGSVQYAISKVPAGSTIVLRGGNYHESVTIPSGKRLTIQAYPGEPVWFDGSSVVTGWSKSGSSWVVSNWNYDFDYRVSFSKGVDESSRFLDAAYPMAGHPDQLWINGVAQRQVSSVERVAAGTFFVDRSGNRLIIGSDPSGKRVDASTLSKAIQVQAEDTVLRGFGVRRYANNLSLMGALSAEVPRVTLENMVVTENATVGLYAWSSGHTFRNITVSNNGMMGFGANKANSLSVTNSIFDGNNTEHFKWAPVSGGIKITESENVSVSGSSFSDNKSLALWFDVSSYNLRIVNNVFRSNTKYGVLVELSEQATIVDNYFVNNGKGAVVFNAGTIGIWNNTFTGNGRTLEFMQDERRQSNSALSSKIPWIVRSIVVNNNVVAYGSDFCPILTQDLTKRWYGNDFGITLDGNLYHRASNTSPSNFACWANGSAGTKSFKTFTDFRNQTGSDRNSAAREGTAVLDASFSVTASAAGAAGLAPRPLSNPVASIAGVAVGTARVGALTAY